MKTRRKRRRCALRARKLCGRKCPMRCRWHFCFRAARCAARAATARIRGRRGWARRCRWIICASGCSGMRVCSLAYCFWAANGSLKILALLRVARDEFGLKTCLYTGLEREEVLPMLLPELSFLKTGRWLPERGGLDNPNTNQRFVDLETGADLTSSFWRRQ